MEASGREDYAGAGDGSGLSSARLLGLGLLPVHLHTRHQSPHPPCIDGQWLSRVPRPGPSSANSWQCGPLILRSLHMPWNSHSAPPPHNRLSQPCTSSTFSAPEAPLPALLSSSPFPLESHFWSPFSLLGSTLLSLSFPLLRVPFLQLSFLSRPVCAAAARRSPVLHTGPD